MREEVVGGGTSYGVETFSKSKYFDGIYDMLTIYTIFCLIQAPPRTPKSPEGRVHSGLISPKSNDVVWLRGFPKVLVLFLMREIICYMRSCTLN